MSAAAWRRRLRHRACQLSCLGFLPWDRQGAPVRPSRCAFPARPSPCAVPLTRSTRAWRWCGARCTAVDSCPEHRARGAGRRHGDRRPGGQHCPLALLPGCGYRACDGHWRQRPLPAPGPDPERRGHLQRGRCATAPDRFHRQDAQPARPALRIAIPASGSTAPRECTACNGLVYGQRPALSHRLRICVHRMNPKAGIGLFHLVLTQTCGACVLVVDTSRCLVDPAGNGLHVPTAALKPRS